MKIEPFALERWQSEWENRAPYNLAESGVLPLSLEEALDGEQLQQVLRLRLGYGHTNGTPALRAAVAALYPGAGPANVIATLGAAEANFVALWRLVEPGDEVVAVLPNYMQLPGLVTGFNATLVPVWMKNGRSWRLDTAELRARVGPRTRAICICHPNNPTGAVLTAEEMDAVASIAATHGTWILADEVYRDAVREGEPAPSFWGRGERVLVTSGLSKAYGLPGLRLGWVLGPPDLVADLWGRRDYTTISPPVISDAVAAAVLQPERRHKVLGRTRAILRDNHARLARWVASQSAHVGYVPPAAGAVAFLRYRWRVGSTGLAQRLLNEQGVLVVPGDQFGMDGYLRLGFGYGAEQLEAGLHRVGTVFATLEV